MHGVKLDKKLPKKYGMSQPNYSIFMLNEKANQVLNLNKIESNTNYFAKLFLIKKQRINKTQLVR